MAIKIDIKDKTIIQPKRSRLYDIINEKISSGQLKPKSNLRENTLARELKVSRTPIREALLQLAQDGLVKHNANHGFTVAPLNFQEIEDLYPIVWTLEGFALNLTKELINPLIPELKKINQQLTTSFKDPKKSLLLDKRWHETLIINCPNLELQNLIQTLKTKITRFDYLYMQSSGLIHESIKQHNKIIIALKNGNFKEATEHLQNNWEIGLRWMKRFNRLG